MIEMIRNNYKTSNKEHEDKHIKEPEYFMRNAACEDSKIV